MKLFRHSLKSLIILIGFDLAILVWIYVFTNYFFLRFNHFKNRKTFSLSLFNILFNLILKSIFFIEINIPFHKQFNINFWSSQFNNLFIIYFLTTIIIFQFMSSSNCSPSCYQLLLIHRFIYRVKIRLSKILSPISKQFSSIVKDIFM